MRKTLTENRFYVYILLDPRKGVLTPFYVGKGQGIRGQTHLAPSSTRYGKNLLKNRVIDRIRADGLKPIMVKYQENMTEEAAYDLERLLIARYGRRDKQTGILTNLTDGGEGGSGVLISDETREKMRQRMSGAGSPTFGVGHTAEARAKMSKAQRERAAKGEVTRHSEEHKQRLRENNPGGKATRKEVYKLTLAGKHVETYESLSALAKLHGMSKANCLKLTVADGTIPRDGFFYRYADSTDITEHGIKNAESLIRQREASDKGLRAAKKIIKIDPATGEVVETFESLRAAAAAHPEVKYATLWAAIENNRVQAGHLWKRSV